MVRGSRLKISGSWRCCTIEISKMGAKEIGSCLIAWARSVSLWGGFSVKGITRANDQNTPIRLESTERLS